jgi:hypothetical protein
MAGKSGAANTESAFGMAMKRYERLKTKAWPDEKSTPNGSPVG